MLGAMKTIGASSLKEIDRFNRPSSASSKTFKEDTPVSFAPSGLSVRLFARTRSEINRMLVEILRDARGLTDSEYQKTRAKVVVALSHKLATGNIMGMLTYQELDDYDIAADSHRR